jgi:hypothetical protein
VGSLGGFARASDVLFRAHVSGVNPKTARFQIWRNTVIQIWQIFSDEDVVRPARARRGVHALSALQHVFLVVVALVLLGASTVRAYGYEPTCAASYENSTDVVKADVLPGTPGIHAFTANNVLYARLDITYNATGTDTVHLFLWGASGVNSSSVCGAWQGGITSTHELFMGVACNAGGSGGISANPYLDAGGRYVLEYYYDSQSSNARMYKTCMGLCGANETLGVTIELTPAGGVAVNMFMSDGQISVGHEDHSVNPPSPDSDFTGTFHSAAFYDCPPPPPCDINEHVASNVCTACIGGSTNPAGDDPYGANTTCGCSTNTSVVYNVCTACVGGSTNPAGDDPGGANTTCGCSTNTSVVSNVCTPCGHGGSTDAGDAVPGPDTQCIYPTGLEALRVHLVADDVADNAYGSWDDRVETLSFTPPGLEDCGFCSGNTVSFAPTLVNNAFNGHKTMRFGFGDYNIYNVTGLTGLVAPNGSQTVFHSHPTQAGVTAFVVFRPMAHTTATDNNFVFDWGSVASYGFGLTCAADSDVLLYTPTFDGGARHSSTYVPEQKAYVAAVRVAFGSGGCGYQSVTSQDGDVTVGDMVPKVTHSVTGFTADNIQKKNPLVMENSLRWAWRRRGEALPISSEGTSRSFGGTPIFCPTQTWNLFETSSSRHTSRPRARRIASNEERGSGSTCRRRSVP